MYTLHLSVTIWLPAFLCCHLFWGEAGYEGWAVVLQVEGGGWWGAVLDKSQLLTAAGGGAGCPEAGVRLLHLDGERRGGGCGDWRAGGRYFGVEGPARRTGKTGMWKNSGHDIIQQILIWEKIEKKYFYNKKIEFSSFAHTIFMEHRMCGIFNKL